MMSEDDAPLFEVETEGLPAILIPFTGVVTPATSEGDDRDLLDDGLPWGGGGGLTLPTAPSLLVEGRGGGGGGWRCSVVPFAFDKVAPLECSALGTMGALTDGGRSLLVTDWIGCFSFNSEAGVVRFSTANFPSFEGVFFGGSVEVCCATDSTDFRAGGGEVFFPLAPLFTFRLESLGLPLVVTHSRAFNSVFLTIESRF
mmetsp:Transcript_20510/g.59475  ORF Transcript_20510/g.59475 Transcript_20510/m.59475 type:complete len:200 (-) Transcript_20510:4495-5094(-)